MAGAPANVGSAIRGGLVAVALVGSPYLVSRLMPASPPPDAPAPAAAAKPAPEPVQVPVVQPAPPQAPQAPQPQRPPTSVNVVQGTTVNNIYQGYQGPPPGYQGPPPGYPGSPYGQQGMNGTQAIIAAERTATPDSVASKRVSPPYAYQNGTYSSTLYQPFFRNPNLATPAETATCALPSDGRTVLLRPATSAMASAVWVGSSEGSETSFARLNVSDDADAFRVVMVPQPTPMVWEFSGAMAKLREVVVAASSKDELSRLAFTGIDFAKLKFVLSPDCVRAVAKLSGATTVEPDVVTTLPSGAPGVAVSDARVVNQPSSRGARWDAEVRKTFPNGTIEVNPALVLSAGRIGRYVLPARAAGIAKLLSQNVISEVPGQPRTFRTSGGMRIPAALCGTEAVTFVVRNSSSLPEGDACDSCIIAEGNDVPLKGRRETCMR